MNAAASLRPVSRRSLAIAAFSTIVEWYDFTLYLYFATVLSRVFFGGGAASLLTTLGGFAIAYLMRPLGAVFFGHIGDRQRPPPHDADVGGGDDRGDARRRRLLPTFSQVGIAAGLLLFLLRCVMGFSVGGEYTGVVAYLLEGAPRHRRGLIASSASAASEVGALLAVGISALTVASMSEASLASWGWRIPFLFGAALAGSVWIARAQHGGIARIPPPEAAERPSPTARSATASPTTRRRSPAPSRSRRWARSLIMSGSPMSPPS